MRGDLMPNGGGYWRKRFSVLEDEDYRSGEKYYRDLQKQFTEAANSIQLDINKWYGRLADNNDISYAAAKRLLKADELKEFKWSVNQYIKHGEENALNNRWMKELENASAKYHINYLEAMKLQTQQHVESLYSAYENGVRDHLSSVYKHNVYKTAYEVAKGTGSGQMIGALDEKRINSVINHPWASDGDNFSSRIWTNKNRLINTLHKELSQSIIRGEAPDRAIYSLSKQMGVCQRQAARLIQTETAAVASQAQKDCFKELDVEEYEVVATLDTHTSDICQEMDGKVFKISEYEVGLTAPPFHPNCRSCTCPYFNDEFTKGSGRTARDADGNNYSVPADMKYGEWKDKYVANNNSSGIMKLPRYESAVIPKEKFTEYALNHVADPNKAKAFKEALGYDLSNVNDLINNIYENLDKFEAIKKSDNGYGDRYQVIMKLTGPNEKVANVLTAWIDDKKNGQMRLVTAHIDK